MAKRFNDEGELIDDDDEEAEEEDQTGEDDPNDIHAIIGRMIDDPKTRELIEAKLNTPSKPSQTPDDLEERQADVEDQVAASFASGVRGSTESRDSRSGNGILDRTIHGIQAEEAIRSKLSGSEQKMLDYLLGTSKQASIREDIHDEREVKTEQKRQARKTEREKEVAAKKEAKRTEGMDPDMIRRMKEYDQKIGK